MYLDTAATKYHIDEEIWDKCYALAKEGLGNPSSLHQVGVRAKNIMNHARKEIAKSIRAKADQIIFFDSATEANNYLQRCFDFVTARSVEHSSMNVFDIYDIDNSKELNKSCFTHIMASNITGEIFNIKDMVKKVNMSRGYKEYFHTDATSAYGRINIDVNDLGVDFMTLPSSHKLGLFGGCCPLYVRDKDCLKTFGTGGEQEGGFHRGTENVMAIYSYGLYAQRINEHPEFMIENDPCLVDKNKDIISFIKDIFNSELGDSWKICYFTPSTIKTMIPIVLVAFKDIDAETLQIVLSNREIYVSTLSACSSGKKDDRILSKLHLPDDFKNGTIRISWDEREEKELIENDIKEIAALVKKMQGLKDIR